MSNWNPRTPWIDVRTESEVAVVTLQRPEKLNALTHELRLDLAEALRLFGDGTRARGVVVTGSGTAFSAGQDLTDPALIEPADGVAKAVESFHDLTRAALQTVVPTVAALNGLAVGGASEFTLCLDRRIASKEAGYYLPENGIGLVISNASSLLLPRLLGPSAARDFVLRSRRVDATEAASLGLVDEVVDGDVVAAAVEWVRAASTENSATAEHVRLLRPTLQEIDAAMVRETAAAAEAWKRGVSSTGVARFASRRS